MLAPDSLSHNYTAQAARVHGADGEAGTYYLGARKCQPVKAFLRLREREREACILAAFGRTNKEIARDMGISEATVKVHLREAMHLLGLGSRTALVLIVRPHGDVGRDAEISDREDFILRHLCSGVSQPQIADALDITESEAKSALRALYTRLHVSGRVEAARWAFNRLMGA
jgi:DNA-binding CsgD family transcriptional regulator